MGKLTHIDDDSDEMAAAQELIAAQRQDGAPASSPAREPAREPEPATAPEPQPTRKDEAPERVEAQRLPDAPGPSRHAGFQRAPQGRAPMTAQEEEDFHGLGSGDSMGVGQGVLVAAAIVVFVAAILYILNSWIHFI